MVVCICELPKNIHIFTQQFTHYKPPREAVSRKHTLAIGLLI